mgnify:CR=1 FL=1
MDQNTKKFNVAKAVIEYIHNDCILGMGTGSTVNFLIEMLPDVRNKISGIASSSLETERLLKSKGFDVQPLSDFGNMDLYIDGADEANRHLHLIKGGGAALTREKIVAAVAQEFICIADQSKLVNMLGEFPLPVEVIPMARSYVARKIVGLGGTPVYREGVVTDNGNHILDVRNMTIDNACELERNINQITGVVTNGLFALRPANVLLLASVDGVDTLKAE